MARKAKIIQMELNENSELILITLKFEDDNSEQSYAWSVQNYLQVMNVELPKEEVWDEEFKQKIFEEVKKHCLDMKNKIISYEERKDNDSEVDNESLEVNDTKKQEVESEINKTTEHLNQYMDSILDLKNHE